ncbi:hypothetical protein EVG20_g2858 [Dentipellis fragilis]|uniref:Ribosomal protein/NADH dehydrogenase domain-containing protein n=1 Tax=Dentipellis fragilis TaxID=205917 RepID=A0A4Y9Z8I9_9AGAM|nr:hypothetical protein EVG20_g2858 [Dentipellis fragilis]
MPRRTKAILGPSRLSQILLSLNRDPKPVLHGVKALRLTLAARNDHFGARHFVKEDLPRIQYANQGIEVLVNKRPKSPTETWNPELVLEYRNGSAKTFDLSQKWSTSIFQEVMDAAGGQAWSRWKAKRHAASLPVLDNMPESASPLAKHPSAAEKTGAAAVLP